ncbi:MAG TPA: hypothetical protein DHV36_25950 [Desulfobacteraceae bacterium]|nr:hypothetical protein [Desulfobacteraceae bacterium]
MFRQNLSLSESLTAGDFELIFGAIMTHSKDGLFVVDARGIVVMVNHATEEMFDFDGSAVLGRNVKDLVAEGFYQPSVSLLVIREKKAITLIQTTHKGKRILSTGIPIFDDGGKVRFVLVNDRDVSHINRLADTLVVKDGREENLRMDFSDLGLAANLLEGMVIRSPAMEKVIRTAVRAARFDVPLIITGDSGVGKTMIAKLIHHLSDRRNQPFADLNCGAITESLIESELFGHEAGAFTGAAPGGKKGLFEIAHRGTLFLDEIGEIPLAVQAKLLKFIESMELIRVGGTRPVKINTRIIVATNRDLEKMVAQGKFRSDLYFRLNVVPIEIPNLSNRREEIVPLATLFLDQLNREFKTQKMLSRPARNAMTAYAFPGNVRELENLMKRLVAMTEGDIIELHHLPPAFRSQGETAIPCDDSFQQKVADYEYRLITDAVQRYGSQRQAAKMLGINQSTLSRKLKRQPSCIIH